MLSTAFFTYHVFNTCYALETRARRPKGRRGGGVGARRAAAPVIVLDGLPRPGDQVLHLRLGEADVIPGVGQALHAVLKEVVEREMTVANQRDLSKMRCYEWMRPGSEWAGSP